MPVFNPFRDPDNIALIHLFNRATLFLDPPTTLRNDQRLTQRMGMPRRAGTWLKRHNRAADTSRFSAAEGSINAHRTGKIVSRADLGRLGTTASNFHIFL